MKKALLTIAFTAVALFANAFESRLFSVDFNKMEFNDHGHSYNLVEVSKTKSANESVVTYKCINKVDQTISFQLQVSEKGMFVKMQKVEME